jgi:hypothetical protein
MYTSTVLRGAWLALILAILNVSAFAAKPGPCEGPNKNDPSCQEPAPAEPPSPAEPVAPIVHSASVDWANQSITIRGGDLDQITSLILGGTPLTVPTPATNASGDMVLPFNADIAAEVSRRGNYLLTINGNDALSIFAVSEIITPTASVCPCDWENALNSQPELSGAWANNITECTEIPGDISGIVLSDPNDVSVSPLFPFGAAFIATDPVSSVCRLVRVDNGGTTTDLLNERINTLQQIDCASALKVNICAP